MPAPNEDSANGNNQNNNNNSGDTKDDGEKESVSLASSVVVEKVPGNSQGNSGKASERRQNNAPGCDCENLGINTRTFWEIDVCKPYDLGGCCRRCHDAEGDYDYQCQALDQYFRDEYESFYALFNEEVTAPSHNCVQDLGSDVSM